MSSISAKLGHRGPTEKGQSNEQGSGKDPNALPTEGSPVSAFSLRFPICEVGESARKHFSSSSSVSRGRSLPKEKL